MALIEIEVHIEQAARQCGEFLLNDFMSLARQVLFDRGGTKHQTMCSQFYIIILPFLDFNSTLFHLILNPHPISHPT